MADVSDCEPYIAHIAHALWEDGGRASVMVGSGFSLNAIPQSEVVPRLPLWSDLATVLMERLGEHEMSDALRLAETFERTFGRTALDELLTKLVPDALFQPGELHHSLLRLPWTDIFTTNYDTLLERARKFSPYRWSLVQASSDLAIAVRPRIIKLHGSLPSHRPFILTEEDYRTYPIKFAPLVNTVQQSAMENVLCLVGFSGDDPNFLRWAGWVRDHLGPAAPRIYLCGALSLTTSHARRYESLNVIPVDLSSLVTKQKPVDHTFHKRALECFLERLMQYRPDSSSWPAQFDDASLTQRYPQPMPTWLELADRKDASSDLQHVFNYLSKLRSSYPGWVVCPETKRRVLWERHLDRLHSLPKSIWASATARLTVEDRLQLIADAFWCFRLALVPIHEDWIALAEDTLDQLYTFALGQSATALLDPKAAYRNWIESALALAADATIRMEIDRADRWLEAIRPVAHRDAEWNARWHYEATWNALNQLKYAEADALLQSWPKDAFVQFYEGKRAALQAELGYLEEALSTATSALDRMRSPQGGSDQSPAHRSMEAWLRHLVDRLQLPPGRKRDRKALEVRHLASFSPTHYDPRSDEGARFQLTATVAVPQHREIREFDPGVVRSVRSFPEPNISGLVCLAGLHDGLTPLHIEGTSFGDAWSSVARRLAESSPWLAYVSSLRVGHGAQSQEPLSRETIASLPLEVAEYRLGSLVKLVEWGLKLPIARRRAMEPVVEAALLGISRLSVVVGESGLSAAFEAAKLAYLSEWMSESHALASAVSLVLSRAGSAAPPGLLGEWIFRSLALPVSGEGNYGGQLGVHHPEPVDALLSRSSVAPELGSADISESCRQSCLVIMNAPTEARKRSALRLALLCSRGLLNAEQRRLFAEALWSRRDDSGDPVDTGISWSALITASRDTRWDPKPSILKKILQDGPPKLEIPLARGVQENYAQTGHWFHSVMQLTMIGDPLVALDKTSYKELRLRLLAWWKEGRSRLRPLNTLSLEFSDVALVDALAAAMEFVARVVLAAAESRSLSQSQIGSLYNLICDMADRGVPRVVAAPALAKLGLEALGSAALEVESSLLSANSREVSRGARAVGLWAEIARRDSQPIPSSLVNVLINLIRYRSRVGANVAVQLLIGIVPIHPGFFSRKQVATLLDSLSAFVAEDGAPGFAGCSDFPDRELFLSGAARLAAELGLAARATGKAVPPAVDRWEAFALASRLPELRLAKQAFLRLRAPQG